MAITGYELIEVRGEGITVDMLVWRRYRSAATQGLVEATLDANPHVSEAHRVSLFLPIGMQLRLPLDPDALKRVPRPVATVTLFGTVE